MLGSGITPQDLLSSRPTIDARKTLIVLAVTAVLLAASSPGQSPQTLRITPSSAYGDTAVGSATSTLSEETSADADTEWADSDWEQWEAQVREVQAPDSISAGQPLRVDVNAVDEAGLPLADARVEVTWVLSGRQYEDVSTTGIFGNASVTRTIGSACSGKRCVVAVAVTDDNGSGCAYSAFTPK